jgi:hypothetical protein
VLHNESLVQRVERMLRAKGIRSARLLSEDKSELGEMAIFEANNLLLRFVRDRSQEFLDIGMRAHPTEFHQFDDVAVALGWTSVDCILAKQEPESLDSVLDQLASHFDRVQRELTGTFSELTRARIQRANYDRAAALEKRLR